MIGVWRPLLGRKLEPSRMLDGAFRVQSPDNVRGTLYREESAERWFDLVPSEYSDMFLFSSRVVSSAIAAGLTGIDFHPVSLRVAEEFTNDPDLPQYYWGRVLGWIKTIPLCNGVPVPLDKTGLRFLKKPV